MLEIKELSFSFGGQPILKGISATYETGRIHGLVGPNGSGKTTLLKNISRIYRPEAGEINLCGRDCKNMGRRHLSSLVSLVPQNPKVNFPITVYDLVMMGRYPHRKRFQALDNHDKEVVAQALQDTNSAHLKERSLTELSGGEAQLVLIARALATEAELILLDEPTASLDIGNSLAIMELLLELKKKGKTILTSVHDLNLARRFCDTMTILANGAIYYYGSTEKAFTKSVMEEVFGVRIAESSDLLKFQTLF